LGGKFFFRMGAVHTTGLVRAKRREKRRAELGWKKGRGKGTAGEGPRESVGRVREEWESDREREKFFTWIEIRLEWVGEVGVCNNWGYKKL